MAVLPVLGKLGGFLVGGVGDDVMIKPDSKTPEELAKLKLARKVMHYYAISLCGLPSDLLGERPGGSTKVSEEKEYETMQAEALKMDTHRGSSADGIKKGISLDVDRCGPCMANFDPSGGECICIQACHLA